MDVVEVGSSDMYKIPLTKQNSHDTKIGSKIRNDRLCCKQRMLKKLHYFDLCALRMGRGKFGIEIIEHNEHYNDAMSEKLNDMIGNRLKRWGH